jgi:hypothetical protein
MATYHHQQKGALLRWIAGVAALITLAAIAMVGSQIGSMVIYAAVIGAGLAFVITTQFSNMTVEIADGELRWWFGRGMWRKKLPLADITSAEPVRNNWWWGWGIRYYGKGWLYNVSGLEAVEIILTSGKHIRIGTDEPDALASALKRHIPR